MQKMDDLISKESSWRMFNEISPTYDRVNRAMTGYLDISWRKAVGRYLPKHEKIHLLDCATGTADQLITLLESHRQITYAVGIDLAEEMLAIGKEKIEKKGLTSQAELILASALDIPFQSESFDCVTMSFGIRNVSCVSSCLSEIFRVMRPGARLLILESSLPDNPLLRMGHLLYLRKILPSLGALISRQKSAYVYLNKTIEEFPYGKEFCNLLEIHKFINVKAHPLMMGAVSIYQADKPGL